MTEKTVEIYKRFKLSPVCRFLGVCVVILGAGGMVIQAEQNKTPWLPLIVMGLGGGLLLAGMLINRAVTRQEREKAEDEELRKRISGSAVVAYDLYRESPTPHRLEQIEQLYPEAAWLISEKVAGHISEEILLWYLQETDKCAKPGRSVRTTYGMRSAQKKHSAVRKYGKKRLIVSGSVLAIALTMLLICAALSVKAPIERTPEKALGADVGSYTVLEVYEFKLMGPYKVEDGYCYYRMEDYSYVDGPEGLGRYSYIFRIPEGSKERLHYLIRVNDGVLIYGRVIELDGQIVLDGDLYPEMYIARVWPKPLTGISALLAVGSGICTVIFADKYFGKKRR